MRHPAVLFIKMGQGLSRVSFVSFCSQNCDPTSSKSLSGHNPKKALKFPICLGSRPMTPALIQGKNVEQ